MGCCVPRDETADAIDQRIKVEQKKDVKELKLLLLGTGESGKSTLFKNLKRVQGEPILEPRVIMETASTVRITLVEFMIKLLYKSRYFYDLDKEKNAECLIEDNEITIKHAQLLFRYERDTFDTPNEELENLGKAIAYLWALPAIQATFARRYGQFSFSDNVEYFYDKATEIMHPDYTPTEEDILKARVRTTGAVMYHYSDQEASFVITDVGGQRSERKKWVTHFDNISGVIFVTALNHYNAVLFEDEQQNAMHEAIHLFKEYTNISEFDQAEVILFLNKHDLFVELLRTVSLSVCFSRKAGWEEEQWEGPDYVPSPDNPEKDALDFKTCCEQALNFIRDVFMNRSKVQGRVTYCHPTCATDQNNVKAVFWDVQSIIIRANLRKGGLIN